MPLIKTLITFNILLLFACSARADDLLVLAASSLQPPLKTLIPAFQQKTGHRVTLSLGSSSVLARQIVAGGKADVFLSADDLSIKDVEKSGLVVPESTAVFAKNQLVLIAPTSKTPPLKNLQELKTMKFAHLAMGDPSYVPLGKYALACLTSLGLWDAVQSRVIPSMDARAALVLVESWNADLGVAYSTDAASSGNVQVVAYFPEDCHPPIFYKLALFKASHFAQAGKDFRAFLLSDFGRETFKKFGFLER